MKKRKTEIGETYPLGGEDDFEGLAIRKETETVWTYFLIPSQDNSNIITVQYGASPTPQSASHQIGKGVVSFKEGGFPASYTKEFAGFEQLPLKYRDRVKLTNNVSIDYGDGSSYLGRVFHQNTGWKNASELLSFLLFDLNDLGDLEYGTGRKVNSDGTKEYFVDKMKYSEWKKAIDVEVAAEEARKAEEAARAAEERARLEAERQAERERAEAEARAKEERAKAEERAKEEKERAAYNAECKKYGKKYVDLAINYKIDIGMPEELFLKYFSKKRTERQGLAVGTYTLEQVYKSAKRAEYRLTVEATYLFSDESAEVNMFINFENGKLVSYETW